MTHIICYVFNTDKACHSHPPFITKMTTEIQRSPHFQAHCKPFHQTLLSSKMKPLMSLEEQFSCWPWQKSATEEADAKFLHLEMVAKTRERRGMWGKNGSLKCTCMAGVWKNFQPFVKVGFPTWPSLWLHASSKHSSHVLCTSQNLCSGHFFTQDYHVCSGTTFTNWIAHLNNLKATKIVFVLT